MAIGTYYLSKQKVTGVGSFFLLNELQLADSEDGGGEALLGAVVQENKEPLWHVDYPVPLSSFDPRLFVDVLTEMKETLGLNKITVSAKIAAGQQHFQVNKKSSFQLGAGPFPSIPFGGKFSVDHSSTKAIDINYGEGTRYEYIPKGNMIAFYQYLKDNPQALDSKPMLKTAVKFLQKNAFISWIQTAKNWSVTFEKTTSFDAGVEAHLDIFNQDNTINGKVTLHKDSDTKITASVQGDDYYLVALMSTRWDDLKID